MLKVYRSQNDLYPHQIRFRHRVTHRFNTFHRTSVAQEVDLSKEIRAPSVTCTPSESTTGPKRTSETLTLDELGLSEATASVHRGENEALRRLERDGYERKEHQGQEARNEAFMSSFISHILPKEDVQGFLGTMQSCDKWVGSTRPTSVAVTLNGADAKAKYLIDWDPGVNPDNWLFTSAFYNMHHRVYSYGVSGKSDKSELSNSSRSWRSSPTSIFIPPISLPQIFKRKKSGRSAVKTVDDQNQSCICSRVAWSKTTKSQTDPPRMIFCEAATRKCSGKWITQTLAAGSTLKRKQAGSGDKALTRRRTQRKTQQILLHCEEA
ncbi:hypothetical protein IW262DRAFT_1486273 [Armillaria fumosa]|nr:hypothetical protein IW262DRAFT_1486273 [Armillaria fumosa]